MVVHLRSAELAALALDDMEFGYDRNAADGHIRRCSRCRRDVDALRGIVRAGRRPAGDEAPAAPLDSVWDAIAAAVADDRPADRTDGPTADSTDGPTADVASIPRRIVEE